MNSLQFYVKAVDEEGLQHEFINIGLALEFAAVQDYLGRPVRFVCHFQGFGPYAARARAGGAVAFLVWFFLAPSGADLQAVYGLLSRDGERAPMRTVAVAQSGLEATA